jgi:hypothetical protein
MGKMLVPQGTEKIEKRPKPKSKNKKTLGPSLLPSPGTVKTKAGKLKSNNKAKSVKSISPKAAGEKKGTVHRSSRASRGQHAANAETAARSRPASARRQTSKKITAPYK